MTNIKPYRVKSISEFHKIRGLPKPEHPLISVVNLETIDPSHTNEPKCVILDFYSISIKRCLLTKFKYGQQQYDFDEGVMFFIAPGQIFSIEVEPDSKHQKSG